MQPEAPAKVLVVIGSAREESNLRRLAEIASQAARDAGAEVETIDLHELSLPVMVWGDPGQAEQENENRPTAWIQAASNPVPRVSWRTQCRQLQVTAAIFQSDSG